MKIIFPKTYKIVLCLLVLSYPSIVYSVEVSNESKVYNAQNYNTDTNNIIKSNIINQDVSKYMINVKNIIMSNWDKPNMSRPENDNIVVIIRLRILNDGNIVKIIQEKISINQQFNVSVIRAIYKSNPLPVPPGNLFQSNEYAEIGFRFFGKDRP